MKRYKILYMLYMVVALGVTSCSGDFLKEYSQSLARVQSVDDLEELLVGDCNLPLGLYRVSGSHYADNPNYYILHFMSDELEENADVTEDPDWTSSREALYPYFTWQQHVYLDKDGRSSYESTEDGYWTLAYTKINNCNMVMDAADNLSVSTDDEQMRIAKVKGEACFLRAFYYLTLVNLYGQPYAPSTADADLAVPVKVSANVEDKEFSRATVSEVYAQIVTDLADAEQYLATVTAPSSIYHAGIEAVYILRSRVALYMQDWKTAETYAKKAIEKDGYLLNLASLGEDDYPMSKSNPEVIYSNGASCLGNILIAKPKSSYYGDPCSPTWSISDNLYALYKDNDYRKKTYVTTDDDLATNKPTYHKIDNSTASYGVCKDVSDVFSIRTAEAYLNAAEALAEEGEDAAACSYLNQLRKMRIKEGDDVNLSGESLITFVREERERELCLEGHRWFDLRRYSVDTKYPYSKEIIHSFTAFKQNDYWQNVPYLMKMYKLEKNDAAYVLDIPKQETDFQPSLGSNPRPSRSPFETKDVTTDDGDEDDYDYGDY